MPPAPYILKYICICNIICKLGEPVQRICHGLMLKANDTGLTHYAGPSSSACIWTEGDTTPTPYILKTKYIYILNNMSSPRASY